MRRREDVDFAPRDVSAVATFLKVRVRSKRDLEVRNSAWGRGNRLGAKRPVLGAELRCLGEEARLGAKERVNGLMGHLFGVNLGLFSPFLPFFLSFYFFVPLGWVLQEEKGRQRRTPWWPTPCSSSARARPRGGRRAARSESACPAPCAPLGHRCTTRLPGCWLVCVASALCLIWAPVSVYVPFGCVLTVSVCTVGCALAVPG